MNKNILAVLAVFVFAAELSAGVSLLTDVGVNTSGEDLYVITVVSDSAPVTSLSVNVTGEGNLGQMHPQGFDTPFEELRWFDMWPDMYDHDTYAMFNVAADRLLVVSGSVDTIDMLDVKFTGFEPFASRYVVRVVLTGGEAVATIGVVAGGVEYWLIAEGEGNNSALVPEPGGLAFVLGCLFVAGRR